jgi:hypothetical protein
MDICSACAFRADHKTAVGMDGNGGQNVVNLSQAFHTGVTMYLFHSWVRLFIQFSLPILSRVPDRKSRHCGYGQLYRL